MEFLLTFLAPILTGSISALITLIVVRSDVKWLKDEMSHIRNKIGKIFESIAELNKKVYHLEKLSEKEKET